MCPHSPLLSPSKMNAYLAPDSSGHGELPRFPFRTGAATHSCHPQLSLSQDWPYDVFWPKLHFLPRDSPHPMTSLYRGVKAQTAFLTGQLQRALSALELLLGPAEAFVVTASQPNFFLCSILSFLPQRCCFWELFAVNLLHSHLRVCFPGNLTCDTVEIK